MNIKYNLVTIFGIIWVLVLFICFIFAINGLFSDIKISSIKNRSDLEKIFVLKNIKTLESEYYYSIYCIKAAICDKSLSNYGRNHIMTDGVNKSFEIFTIAPGYRNIRESINGIKAMAAVK